MNSEIGKDLYISRNVKKAYKASYIMGIIQSVLINILQFISSIFKDKEPYTLKKWNKDSYSTQNYNNYKPIKYPDPDNVFIFKHLENNIQ